TALRGNRALAVFQPAAPHGRSAAIDFHDLLLLRREWNSAPFSWLHYRDANFWSLILQENGNGRHGERKWQRPDRLRPRGRHRRLRSGRRKAGPHIQFHGGKAERAGALRHPVLRRIPGHRQRSLSAALVDAEL